MTPDLRIIQGTTFQFYLQWFSRSRSGTDVPVDLTGATVLVQIRDERTGDLLVTPTTSIDDALSGLVSCEIAPGATAGATWRAAVWACQVTQDTGEVFEIARGRVTLTPRIVHV